MRWLDSQLIRHPNKQQHLYHHKLLQRDANLYRGQEALRLVRQVKRRLGPFISIRRLQPQPRLPRRYNGDLWHRKQAINENEKIKEDVLKLIHNNSDDKLVLVAKNSKRLNNVEQFVYQTDPKAHLVTLESA